MAVSMRVLLVNISLGPGRGSDLVVSELATRLAQSHSVIVASFKPVDDRDRRFAVLAPRPAANAFSRAVNFLAFARKLRRAARQADIVNCHHAILSHLLPKDRLVTTYHGYRGRLNLRFGSRLGEAISGFVRRAIIAPALRKSRIVTLVSRSLAEEAERANVRCTRVIMNGVSVPQRASSPACKSHFLYAGRLDPDKNVGALLKAYAAVHTEIPLVVAGEGSERADLERRYHGQPIEFVGNVSQEALAELYGSAYAFLTASTFETFCLPVIEAANLGCPSVGPRSGALPEVIRHDETGFLLSEFERELPHFLEVVVSLSEQDRMKMASNCRSWSSHFRWDTVAGQYTDAYRAIAEAGRPGAKAPLFESLSSKRS
jgi:glycosyltransferase involved in cell wall biosynthesis